MERRRLTLQEREEISLGIAQGYGPRAIGRLLGRQASTISREIRRCTTTNRWTTYRAVTGEGRARWLARRPKLRSLDSNIELREYVIAKLKQTWSPQQISKRLVSDYPENENMRISHETIYTWFYLLPKGELKAELLQGLRRGRTKRVAHTRIPKTGPIAGMVSIDERPDEVDERKVPGHWEGDLIIGKAGKTAVGTLVERKTRFTMLIPLPTRRTAEAVRTGLQETLVGLPSMLRRSITWDQGSEMAEHQKFTVDTGIRVYFAHPRSPWERGTNENTNGLLRQFLPKGTELTSDPEILNDVAVLLNGRPRRTLGWRTPAEAFADLIREAVA